MVSGRWAPFFMGFCGVLPDADSSFDAAHLYFTHVTAHPGCGLPIPTTTTTFEVIAMARSFTFRARASSGGSRNGGTNGTGREGYCSSSGR